MRTLKLIRLTLIASILLLISCPSFAEAIDSGSPEYKVIRQAAKEYAIVLGSQTEIDGYQFEKNSLTIRTKRANIVQVVSIELPSTTTIKECHIKDSKLIVLYDTVVDISQEVSKAEDKGFFRGLLYGGAGGGLGGCLFMGIVLVIL